jgi:hypothetical protein
VIARIEWCEEGYHVQCKGLKLYANLCGWIMMCSCLCHENDDVR